MDRSSTTWEALLAERAWLARLARELVYGEAEAEELVGDVLAAASVRELPRKAGPRAWLRALARRHAALRARSAARRARRELRAARAEAQPSALAAAAAFEVQRCVAEAVSSLEEPFRTTVLLRYWENLPPREIARAMGCPVETVSSRLKRAHAKLRATLDARNDGRREAWAIQLCSLEQRLPTGADGGILCGAALGGGAKLALVLVAAAGLIAASLWLASGDTPAPPEFALQARVAPVAERELHAELSTERTPAIATAPHAPAASDPPPLRFLVRGRVIADEDERPLRPQAAYLRDASVELEELPLRVGAEPELCFEVELTQEQATRIRELGFALEARAPLRSILAQPALERAPGHVLELGVLRSLRGSRFAGRVVDEAGRGVAGVRLLVPRSRMAWGASMHPENLLADVERVGTTDESGHFVLEKRLELAVGHTHLFAATKDELAWTRIAPTRGGEPEPAELELRLRPKGALVARVLDEHGERVAGARVVVRPRWSPLGVERVETAFSVSNDPLVAARFEAVSDERGLARFLALPLGDDAEGTPGLSEQFTARVEPEAGSEGPWQVVRLGPQREVEIELRTRATEPVVPQPPVAEPAETRVLTGRATDASGAPARGFFLFLEERFVARIQDDGSFRVAAFPIGAQSVVLAQSPEAGPGWTGKFTPEVVDAAAGPVHFLLERRADPGLKMRFEIVAQESGGALDPLEVLLWPIDARGAVEGRPEHPRIEGSRLLAEGTSGRWRLGVRTACGRRWQGVIEIPGGRELYEQRCELPPTGTVEVELVAGENATSEDTASEKVALSARFVRIGDPQGWGNFTYAGEWAAGAALYKLGQRAVLRHADTTQPLRIDARAGDLRGSVEIHARPNQVVSTRLVLER
jgi:RNA polymerase sigma-70 factor (ECF subfamily)